MPFKPLFASLAAAMLAACTTLTPAGLQTAMRLDPLTTPPAALSVAVSVPKTVRIMDGDAVMTLGFAPEDETEALPVTATVPLSVVEDARAPAATVAGDSVYVLTLGPEAVARITETQGRIRVLKAQEIAGKGTLSVAVTGGCLTGPLGDTLPVATWLRPDPAEPFVALTRRADFFTALSDAEAEALRARLRPC